MKKKGSGHVLATDFNPAAAENAKEI